MPETLALSLGKLNKSAKQLLNVLSFMAPEKIPLDFFERQREHLPPPLCEDLRDRLKTIDAVSELTNYSLAMPDGDAYIEVHRIVQEIVRELLGEEADTDLLGVCLEAMAAAMPDIDDYGRPEQREWFERISAHAVEIANRAACNPDKEVRAASLCFSLGVGFDELAQYEQALEWYNKALGIREKVLGAEHPDTAYTYNNIAIEYYEQCNYPKALEWHQKALGIREKVLGAEHPDTAATYNNIAVVYRNQGNYPKALELYHKSYIIGLSKLGATHPDTIATRKNMEAAYEDSGLDGKFDDWLNSHE